MLRQKGVVQQDFVFDDYNLVCFQTVADYMEASDLMHFMQTCQTLWNNADLHNRLPFVIQISVGNSYTDVKNLK